MLCEKALFRSVRDANDQQLKHILSRREASPETQNQKGEPLIVYAAKKSFLLGVKILIGYGADLNAKNRSGRTALHVATEHKDTAIMILLLKSGAHRNARDQRHSTILHLAAKSGDMATFDCIIKYKEPCSSRYCALNLNALDHEQRTPLVMAACRMHHQIVARLLSLGARADIPNNEGYTLRTYDILRGYHLRQIEYVDCSLYTKEFIQRKELVHVCDLEGTSQIGKYTLDLTGSYEYYMRQLVLQGMQEFATISSGHFSSLHRRQLIYAFERSLQKREASLILQSVQARELVVLSGGWLRHNVVFVFYKNYMAICNSGQGTGKVIKTVEMFKINPSLLQEKHIQSIMEMKKQPYKQAWLYVYHDLPEALSCFDQDQLCKWASEIAPPPIQQGTCTYASALVAARVGMFLLKTATVNPRYYRAIATVTDRETNSMALFCKLTSLHRYLQDHQPDHPLYASREMNLLDRVLIQVTSGVAKERACQVVFQQKLNEVLALYQAIKN